MVQADVRMICAVRGPHSGVGARAPGRAVRNPPGCVCFLKVQQAHTFDLSPVLCVLFLAETSFPLLQSGAGASGLVRMLVHLPAG